MGKIVGPGAGHIRHRSVHRMSNRHVGPYTELKVPERWPDERV